VVSCFGEARRALARCAAWEAQQRARCAAWRTEQHQRCDRWRQQQEQRCDRYRTTSEQRCDRWETESSRTCSSWGIFSFLCQAWVWVTTTVCRVWTTVTTTVCDLWTTVTTTVCDLWTTVSTLVCTLWTITTTFVCRLWAPVLAIWCVLRCLFSQLLARIEHRFFRTECRFAWFAAFRADLDEERCVLRVTLRIRLVPEAGVTAADITTVQQRWEPAIESTWTGQHDLVRRSGDCRCERVRVEVDVRWVTSGEHHTVRVSPGGGRANMGNWFVDSGTRTAAHEAGHMFGNVDEYAEPDVCPDRDVRTDGSIMASGTTVHPRHYQPFATWLSNRTCCTYEVAERG
jgi:hypothetical protein